MNTATFTSLSNAPLLPICNYINAFSIFFINIDLMINNEKNQSVPVINALFNYLNKSNNESLAKSHLLQEVFIKANVHQNDTILDMKYVNETYQYIIINSLFHRCGNITEYLSGHENRKEGISFSAIRNIVHEALSDKCIKNASCSTRSGFKKLTPLAIQKLVEYVWSAYHQERLLQSFSNDVKKEKVMKHKRFRRQPPTYTNNIYEAVHGTENKIEPLISGEQNSDDDFSSNMNDFSFDNAAIINTVTNSAEDFGTYADIYNKRLNSEDYSQRPIDVDVSEFELLIKTEPDAAYDITNEERQQFQEFLQDDANHQSNLNDFSFDNAAITNTLPNSVEGFDIDDDINNKRLNREEYSQTPKEVQRIDYGNDNSAMNTNLVDNQMDVDNVQGTSSVLQHKYSKRRKLANRKSVEMIDSGKSKRMLSIVKATEYISSRMPNRNSADIEVTLKRFLLKLEDSGTRVPTYDTFAIDFCDGVDVFTKYKEWIIPNHTFIDDVLFQSYFDDIGDHKYEKIKSCSLFANYPGDLMSDIKMYDDSIELKKSLRLQDFLYLKLNLQYSQVSQVSKRKISNIRLMTALYRLALRECEEAWVEKNITLYGYSSDRTLPALKNNLTAGNNYTFDKYVEFYVNRSETITKVEERARRSLLRNFVMFSVIFDNLAGVVNIGRLFKENTTLRYVVPPKVSFPIIQTGEINILEKKKFLIEMRDKFLKEEKMVDMVKKLFDIFDSDKEIFRYYDPNMVNKKPRKASTL